MGFTAIAWTSQSRPTTRENFLQKTFREKSRPAVGVDQERLVRRNERGDAVGEVSGNRVVRLRKDARTASRAQGVVTIARAPGAQRGEFFVHLRQGDRAALDIDQSMGVMAEKSDDAVLDVDRDSVAIFVIVRRRDDRAQWRFTEFSDALQGLPRPGAISSGADARNSCAGNCIRRTCQIGTVRAAAGGRFQSPVTSSASAKDFFSLTMRAVTRSRSMVKGTKTALPSARPTPLPPKAMSSMTSSTSPSICRSSQTAAASVDRGQLKQRRNRRPRSVFHDGTGSVPYNSACTALQIGIFFRDLAKVFVHLEADFQMPPRFLRMTEERFVTAEIVIVDRLATQCRRTFQEHHARLFRAAELVQTKSGMEKSRSAIGSDAAEFAAKGERALPRLAQSSGDAAAVAGLQADSATLSEWHSARRWIRGPFRVRRNRKRCAIAIQVSLTLEKQMRGPRPVVGAVPGNLHVPCTLEDDGA